ncbi:MAG: ccr4 associated factor [Watsoniomyces obsoletus]|nr:MAG: ccr4 associated factor [Watsoniomyces obsoletus]
MLGRTPSRFICHQCAKGRRRYSDLPSSTSPPKAAKLTNRRLISVQGQDAAHFLQGLTTNNIRPEQTSGFYSAFLTAQGRVLNDVFIYPTSHSRAYTNTLPSSVTSTGSSEPGYLIEVDSSEAQSLFTHIKRYRLRAKVLLKLLDEGQWNTWSIWNNPPHEHWTTHYIPEQLTNPHKTEDTIKIGCIDARAPGMGQRVILPGDSQPDILSQEGSKEASLEEYIIRRILKGVAEGQREIPRETSLPQESNIDFMGGIDFRKGCYVGQELTIRTHHTGVVRKRILPVELYPDGASPPLKQMEYHEVENKGVGIVTGDEGGKKKKVDQPPPPGTTIFRVGDDKKRSTGKWLDGIGRIGLALCRLEIMTDTKLPAGRLLWTPEMEFMAEWVTENGKLDGRVNVKAFVPGWMKERLGQGREREREKGGLV